GPVHNDRGGLEAVHQRGSVDVGLERRARLTVRVGGTVELAGDVVGASHHGAHRAVEISHHYGGLFGMIVAPELTNHGLHRVLGGALQPEVNCGAHHKGAVRDVAGGRRFDKLLHLV